MNFAKKNKEEEKRESRIVPWFFLNVVWCKDVFVSMECAELFDWKVREFPREFVFFFFYPKKRREQQTEGFFEAQSFQGHQNSTWSHDCCRFISISRVSVGKFALMFVTGWISQLVSSWIHVFIKNKVHFYCFFPKFETSYFWITDSFWIFKNCPQKKRWNVLIKWIKTAHLSPSRAPSHQLRTVTHQEVPSLRVLDGSMKYNKLH